MTATTDLTGTGARLAASIMALPPLPVTAQRILTCFGDEFIDVQKVAVVVEGDPGICAKLLGLSNSAYFGLAEPVNSIGEAISRVLGVDTVRSLVLAMAIQQSFNKTNCPAFDTDRFWMKSLFAAECCKKIALADELADESDRDLAFSAGLCHNLGLMALSHMEPARTNGVLEKHASQDTPASLVHEFNEEFGTNHRILTAELARNWSLPQPIIAAYQLRAHPEAHCDVRLGFIVAAGICAVTNTEMDEASYESLGPWAGELGIPAEDLQSLAHPGPRELEQIRSLANNITR